MGKSNVYNLALMDIPRFDAVCRTARRILRPSGWFSFSITHPCFESPHAKWNSTSGGKISREVFAYFQEGLWYSHNPNGVRGQVGAYHRMLSTYVNTPIKTGFAIADLIEPRATNAHDIPTQGYRVIPAFLLIRCVKL